MASKHLHSATRRSRASMIACGLAVSVSTVLMAGTAFGQSETSADAVSKGVAAGSAVQTEQPATKTPKPKTTAPKTPSAAGYPYKPRSGLGTAGLPGRLPDLPDLKPTTEPLDENRIKKLDDAKPAMTPAERAKLQTENLKGEKNVGVPQPKKTGLGHSLSSKQKTPPLSGYPFKRNLGAAGLPSRLPDFPDLKPTKEPLDENRIKKLEDAKPAMSPAERAKLQTENLKGEKNVGVPQPEKTGLAHSISAAPKAPSTKAKTSGNKSKDPVQAAAEAVMAAIKPLQRSPRTHLQQPSQQRKQAMEQLTTTSTKASAVKPCKNCN